MGAVRNGFLGRAGDTQISAGRRDCLESLATSWNGGVGSCLEQRAERVFTLHVSCEGVLLALLARGQSASRVKNRKAPRLRGTKCDDLPTFEVSGV